MAEGAWIFLSHSHKNFDRVSGVRNFLEGQHHHPLMFFLKCLSDDDEIDDVIRREIESRSWFILCDSANARRSRWVQAERRVIAGLPTKTYTEIDLEDPRRDLESELLLFTRKASVFLSYGRGDGAFAERIRNGLRKHDFSVFSDLDLKPGEAWPTRIRSELQHAARRGAILVLLSTESVRSEWLRQELRLATELARQEGGRAHVVPVFLEGVDVLPSALPFLEEQISGLSGLELGMRSFEEGMTDLMLTLRRFERSA